MIIFGPSTSTNSRPKWLQINHIHHSLSVSEKGWLEKGAKLREVLSSLRIGESIVLHDVWLMRKNTRARIYATPYFGMDGEESLIILAFTPKCAYS